MLSQLTWEQYMGWYRYSQLEPWGEERADLRAGIVASVVANVNRDPQHKPEPYKPDDFTPDFAGDRVAEPMNKSKWQETKERIKSYAKAGVFMPKAKPKRVRRKAVPTP